jgi:VWFA-related protein
MVTSSMHVSYRAATVLLFLSFLSLPVLAQQTAKQEAAEPSPEIQQLVLDVVVHDRQDRSNKPVAGLHAEDFIVLDNKKVQKVVSFVAVDGHTTRDPLADPPAEILLLVDEVNVGFNRVAYERDQIKKFALQNGGKLTHPVSIGFFTDQGTQLAHGSTQDGNELVAAFDAHETKLRTMRRSQGFYGAVDRFQLSLSTLNTLASAEAERPGRKMVVWISPGWAYLSGPGIQLSRREENGLFASIVSTSDALRRARITLYSIDPLGVEDAGGLRVNYYQEFLKPALKPSDVEVGNLALQVIATQTGGLALNSSNNISAQIDRCVADADAYYTLTIEPPPSEKPNDFHGIEVKIETPGLIARTRNGYYGQP